MEYDVFVLEIISSGPGGYPEDEVVDIGICGIRFEDSRIDSIYSATVRCDTSEWDDTKKNRLISCGISIQEIMHGIPVEDVCARVKDILNNRAVASFDVRNVFSGYMVNDPWDLTKEVSIMPSVSSRLPASMGCRIPSDENVCIRNAYNRVFDDDPMNIKAGENALDHALMTSAILLRLRKTGRY